MKYLIIFIILINITSIITYDQRYKPRNSFLQKFGTVDPSTSSNADDTTNNNEPTTTNNNNEPITNTENNEIPISNSNVPLFQDSFHGKYIRDGQNKGEIYYSKKRDKVVINSLSKDEGIRISYYFDFGQESMFKSLEKEVPNLLYENGDSSYVVVSCIEYHLVAPYNVLMPLDFFRNYLGDTNVRDINEGSYYFRENAVSVLGVQPFDGGVGDRIAFSASPTGRIHEIGINTIDYTFYEYEDLEDLTDIFFNKIVKEYMHEPESACSYSGDLTNPYDIHEIQRNIPYIMRSSPKAA